MLVHQNFMGMCENLIIFMVVASYFEFQVGHRAFLWVMIMTGVCGNIFGNLWTNLSCNGLFTPVFGIWGAMISLVVQEAYFNT